MKKTVFGFVAAIAATMILGSCGNCGKSTCDADSCSVDTVVADTVCVDSVVADTVCAE